MSYQEGDARTGKWIGERARDRERIAGRPAGGFGAERGLPGQCRWGGPGRNGGI